MVGTKIFWVETEPIKKSRAGEKRLGSATLVRRGRLTKKLR